MSGSKLYFVSTSKHHPLTCFMLGLEIVERSFVLRAREWYFQETDLLLWQVVLWFQKQLFEETQLKLKYTQGLHVCSC